MGLRVLAGLNSDKVLRGKEDNSKSRKVEIIFIRVLWSQLLAFVAQESAVIGSCCTMTNNRQKADNPKLLPEP